MMDDGNAQEQTRLRGRLPAFDLQHFRYTIAAADHGSFRRAAESLGLKQSTLSRRIHQIEEQMDVKLFERSSGGVRATLAGSIFLATARSILAGC